MRFVTSLLLSVAAGLLVSTAVGAQPCTNSYGNPRQNSGDKIYVNNAGVPGSAVSDGISEWQNGCTDYGSNFPSFSSTAAGTFKTVNVNWVNGHGAEDPQSHTSPCGLFDGSQTVTVYSSFTQSGIPGSCGNASNLADTVAHELGHVLGLGDAPDSGCSTYIMAKLNYNSQTGQVANRDVQTNECQRADAQNVMPTPTPTRPPIKYCPPSTPNCNSPILINRSASPYDLTDAAEGVNFDLDADGTAERIGWTAGGTPQAFLWLDRNGDGTVADGAELFGNHTFLQDGTVAANGFQALAEFDGNRDGVIDGHDSVWSQLMLWTDANHDGISQASEVESVAASDIARIGVNYSFSFRRDRFGNLFRYRSTVWQRVGGSTIQRPVYDVFFVGSSSQMQAVSQTGQTVTAPGVFRGAPEKP